MPPAPRRKRPSWLIEYGRCWWVPPLDTTTCRWCGAAWWRLAGGHILVCPICDRPTDD